MASIDKTYVNFDEYNAVVKFFTAEMYALAKAEIGFAFEYNKYSKQDFDLVDNVVLWNTSSVVDVWLAKNCDLPFIQSRLAAQYSAEWLRHASKADYSTKGYIYKISVGEQLIQPFAADVSDNNTTVYQDLLVYGTTTALKIFDEVNNVLLRGTASKDSLVNYFLFEAYGKLYKWTNDKFYEISEGDEQSLTLLAYPFFVGSLNDHNFGFIGCIHSYDLNDAKDYEECQIVLSFEDRIAAVEEYISEELASKTTDADYMRRPALFLPSYIKQFLKKD